MDDGNSFLPMPKPKKVILGVRISEDNKNEIKELDANNLFCFLDDIHANAIGYEEITYAKQK